MGLYFLYEFEKFAELVKNKCRVIILSSSDNKRDIDKIVNNDHVIKFVTKPLTEQELNDIKTLGVQIVKLRSSLVISDKSTKQ